MQQLPQPGLRDADAAIRVTHCQRRGPDASGKGGRVSEKSGRGPDRAGPRNRRPVGRERHTSFAASRYSRLFAGRYTGCASKGRSSSRPSQADVCRSWGLQVTSEVVCLSLNTRKDMSSWSFGRQFVQLLCDFDPRFVPERVGHGERDTGPFVGVGMPTVVGQPDRLSDGRREMGQHRTVLVAAEEPGSCAGPCRSYAPRRSAERAFSRDHESDFGAVADVEWRTFFTRCCRLCEPLFAMLHWFTAHEMNPGTLWSGSPHSDFRLGVSTGNWRNAKFRSLPGQATGAKKPRCGRTSRR